MLSIVKVQFLYPISKLPSYQTLDSAGADLIAAIDKSIIIEPLQTKMISNGIKIELPRGYEGQVRPRSGLAFKYGLTVLNSPGTIDNDYRGEIMTIITNISNKSFTIEPGMRISQIVIKKYEQFSFSVVDELSSSTLRGDGGFGSTGN